MRIVLIGVGQAGGKIADAVLDYDRRTESNVVTSVTAINTARTDLRGLSHVPEDDRVLIGGSRVKGHGVGADNELGVEIARDDIAEIRGALDEVPIGRTDAFLIVAALGGGTGSGAGPVIARELKRLHTEPVYGLGVLPSTEEGGIYQLNAAQSFRTFVRETDNLVVFDNDAWRTAGESLEDGFETINDEIARRLGVLFGAGEIQRGEGIAENVVDSSEIVNTLASGGISAIGYATEELESRRRGGLLSRFTGGRDDREEEDATNRITSLVRKATLGRLTLPCDVATAERALLVVSGPSDELSRKGIQRGRKWLEREVATVEVRGGEYPVDEDAVAAAVLLSGITDVSRIEEVQRTANTAQDSLEARDAGSDDRLEDLLADEEDSIDPLF